MACQRHNIIDLMPGVFVFIPYFMSILSHTIPFEPILKHPYDQAFSYRNKIRPTS